MGFDFFNVLSLIGGLSLFLFGMNIMGDSLAKTAGGKLERILEKLTSTPIRGVLLGAAVTGVIQSSSATTVMVVGFVNSGIMKLSQAIGIIMGANIGTTVTSWILSLTGIEGGNFFVQLCKPSAFSPVLAAVGVVLLLFSKSEKKHDIGTIMLGFAVLMFGMEAMSDAVKPLGDIPQFYTYFNCCIKSIFRCVCRCPAHSNHTEFFSFRWNTSGIVCNRFCIIQGCNSDYYGTEHRNLCYCTYISNRC